MSAMSMSVLCTLYITITFGIMILCIGLFVRWLYTIQIQMPVGGRGLPSVGLPCLECINVNLWVNSMLVTHDIYFCRRAHDLCLLPRVFFLKYGTGCEEHDNVLSMCTYTHSEIVIANTGDEMSITKSIEFAKWPISY